MIQIKPPSRRAQWLLLTLALTATAAAWLGPVLAGGLAAPAMRLAAGQAPSPLLGAVEAGIMGSAIWLVLEA
jgi:hypothetical protein